MFNTVTQINISKKTTAVGLIRSTIPIKRHGNSKPPQQIKKCSLFSMKFGSMMETFKPGIFLLSDKRSPVDLPPNNNATII